MIAEGYLSMQKSGLTQEELNELSEVLKSKFKLKPLPTEKFNDYSNLMIHDKKNSEGKISFSLLSKIGECKWDQFCNKEEILNALTYYNKTVA